MIPHMDKLRAQHDGQVQTLQDEGIKVVFRMIEIAYEKVQLNGGGTH